MSGRKSTRWTNTVATSSNVIRIKHQKISITRLYTAPAVSSKHTGVFWLKTWSKRRRFDTNWTVASSGLLDDTTSSVSDTRQKIITRLCFLKLTSAPLTWWHAGLIFYFDRQWPSRLGRLGLPLVFSKDQPISKIFFFSHRPDQNHLSFKEVCEQALWFLFFFLTKAMNYNRERGI